MSYGKVHDVFWESERIDALSDRAALLGLFLITGPHRNAIGCFRLGIGAITDLPRFHAWGIEGASKALNELVGIGFIVRDDRTGWTFITNTFKHDPIKQDKAAIHALSLIQRVPKNTKVYQVLKEKLEPELERHKKALQDKDGWPLPRPIEGPPKAPPSPLPSPLPEPEPNSSVADATGTGVPEAADLKAVLFNGCLQWFIPRGPKNAAAARRIIGRWIRDHGEGATLQAFMAAQRTSAVDPTAYITKVLNGNAKPASPHKTDADAAAEAIAFFQAEARDLATRGAGDPSPDQPALGCPGSLEETGPEGRNCGPGGDDDAALLHAGELQGDPTRAVH